MNTFPDDAVYTYNTVLYQLKNRKPDRNFTKDLQFVTNTFTSQIGYETSILLNRRSNITLTLNYTNINGCYLAALEQFYAEQYGTFKKFLFDLSYINEVGLISVRFTSPLNITSVLHNENKDLCFYNLSFTIAEKL